MTRREKIFEILKQEQQSAQQLANHFKVEMWEIIKDLKHLARSVKPLYELKKPPASCKKCGFIFKERSKIKKPTKCPHCRGESILPPLFKIEKKIIKK